MSLTTRWKNKGSIQAIKAIKSIGQSIFIHRLIARCVMSVCCLCFGNRGHIDEATSVTAFCKYYSAVDESIKSVVLTHTDIQAWVVNCATLTFQDVAGFCILTAENLDAKAFAF